jgi:hypothetical protein
MGDMKTSALTLCFSAIIAIASVSLLITAASCSSGVHRLSIKNEDDIELRIHVIATDNSFEWEGVLASRKVANAEFRSERDLSFHVSAYINNDMVFDGTGGYVSGFVVGDEASRGTCIAVSRQHLVVSTCSQK